MPELANSKAEKKQWGRPIQPGQVLNPAGRPKGSRNKFGEEFVTDFLESWMREGKAVIERVIKEQPGLYLRIAASILPKEFNIRTDDNMNDEQIDNLISAIRSELDRRRADKALNQMKLINPPGTHPVS